MLSLPSAVVSADCPAVDPDHESIMDALNELGKAISDDHAESVNKCLNHLIDRIIEQFEREEMRMLMLRYGDYDRHMMQHSQFFAHLTKLVYLHESGEGQLNGAEQEQLVAWLLNHERDFDRRLTERLSTICAPADEGDHS